MSEPTSRRRTIGLVLGLVVLQALAVGGYFLVEGRREAGPEVPLRYERVTKPIALPNAQLEARGGEVLDTRTLRGRPVLLHFWATWCPPCREELPGLLGLAERGDVVVVAISLDDDWGAIERFFAGNVPSEVVRDPERALTSLYEVTALPDTYLVDAKGRALARFGGPRRWDSEAAGDELDALVKSVARRRE